MPAEKRTSVMLRFERRIFQPAHPPQPDTQIYTRTRINERQPSYLPSATSRYIIREMMSCILPTMRGIFLQQHTHIHTHTHTLIGTAHAIHVPPHAPLKPFERPFRREEHKVLPVEDKIKALGKQSGQHDPVDGRLPPPPARHQQQEQQRRADQPTTTDTEGGRERRCRRSTKLSVHTRLTD